MVTDPGYFNNELEDATPLELALIYEELMDNETIGYIGAVLEEMHARHLSCNDLEQLLHDYRHDSPSSVEP